MQHVINDSSTIYFDNIYNELQINYKIIYGLIYRLIVFQISYKFNAIYYFLKDIQILFLLFYANLGRILSRIDGLDN
jgi:hypothetical protein